MREAEWWSKEDVSRETIERFSIYEGLLRRWNPVINLVSRNSLEQLGTRHMADSVQIFHMAPEDCDLWCDLGSGGGFPGLVAAIMALDRGWHTVVQLIESDSRKVAFLREVVRQLQLNVHVTQARIEDINPLGANILSARALAPLSKLCEYSLKHLRSDGVAIFPKGANYRAEIADARKTWGFDVEIKPSQTDASAAILVLRNVRHA